MKLKKFAAVALSVALATASMPISGLAAENWYEKYISMEVTSEEKLLLGGSVQLKTDIATNSNAAADNLSAASSSNAIELASASNANWESSNPDFVSVENGVVSAKAYELNGTNNGATITVSSPSGREWGQLDIEVAAPELKATIDNAEISPDKTAQITATIDNVATSVKSDVTYDYVPSNTNIAVSKEGAVSAATNAVNTSTTVTVTAYYAELPIAEAKVDVTVVNATPTTGLLKWNAEDDVTTARLYINSETPGEDTVSIPFTSNYDDEAFKLVVADDTIATAELNLTKDPEDGLRYVKVQAVAAGTTEMTLSHEGAMPITATIVVTDSSKPAEVIVSSTMLPIETEEEVAAMLESDWFAEIPDEDKERAVETFIEILENINNNTAMTSEVAIPTFPDNIDDILIEKGLLKPGEVAVVAVAQMLADYSFMKDSTSGSYEFYMNKLTFDVEPMMTILDSNGDFVTSEFIGEVFEDGKNEVEFILPIPDDSANRFRFAKVTHRDDANRWPDMKGEAGGKFVPVKTKQFSHFIIEFTDTKDSDSSSSGSGWVKPAGGSGSGSGSNVTANTSTTKGSKSGQWQQDEKGWWFRYTDGTYPMNEWVELEWQNVKNWYHFDAQGYIETGWKQDGGTWYYLHPIADGTQGHMYTGWHQIDGQWYYFSTVAGGPLGAMLSNTTTPDGFQVGADGAWIQ